MTVELLERFSLNPNERTLSGLLKSISLKNIFSDYLDIRLRPDKYELYHKVIIKLLNIESVRNAVILNSFRSLLTWNSISEIKGTNVIQGFNFDELCNIFDQINKKVYAEPRITCFVEHQRLLIEAFCVMNDEYCAKLLNNERLTSAFITFISCVVECPSPEMHQKLIKYLLKPDPIDGQAAVDIGLLRTSCDSSDNVAEPSLPNTPIFTYVYRNFKQKITNNHTNDSQMYTRYFELIFSIWLKHYNYIKDPDSLLTVYEQLVTFDDKLLAITLLNNQMLHNLEVYNDDTMNNVDTDESATYYKVFRINWNLLNSITTDDIVFTILLENILSYGAIEQRSNDEIIDKRQSLLDKVRIYLEIDTVSTSFIFYLLIIVFEKSNKADLLCNIFTADFIYKKLLANCTSDFLSDCSSDYFFYVLDFILSKNNYSQALKLIGKVMQLDNLIFLNVRTCEKVIQLILTLSTVVDNSEFNLFMSKINRNIVNLFSPKTFSFKLDELQSKLKDYLKLNYPDLYRMIVSPNPQSCVMTLTRG